MDQNSSDSLLNAIARQHSSLIRTENGFTFRDLNKDGKLDIYEKSRQKAHVLWNKRIPYPIFLSFNRKW